MLKKLFEFFLGGDLGGRMFLTYVAGFCFAYLTVTKVLTPAEAMQTIATVFALYFARNDRQPPKVNDKGAV